MRAPGESAEALVARADAALYEAKAMGCDRTRGERLTLLSLVSLVALLLRVAFAR